MRRFACCTTRRLALSVLSLAVATGIGVAGPGDATGEQFRLVTPTEEAEFRTRMGELEGIERERYRDEQWRRLRARALDHGYLMPAAPPWPAAGTGPAVAAGTNGDASQPAPAAADDAADPGTTPATASAPTQPAATPPTHATAIDAAQLPTPAPEDTATAPADASDESPLAQVEPDAPTEPAAAPQPDPRPGEGGRFGDRRQQSQPWRQAHEERRQWIERQREQRRGDVAQQRERLRAQIDQALDQFSLPPTQPQPQPTQGYWRYPYPGDYPIPPQ